MDMRDLHVLSRRLCKTNLEIINMMRYTTIVDEATTNATAAGQLPLLFESAKRACFATLSKVSTTFLALSSRIV